VWAAILAVAGPQRLRAEAVRRAKRRYEAENQRPLDQNARLHGLVGERMEKLKAVERAARRQRGTR
jgi:hypothetical protein